MQKIRSQTKLGEQGCELQMQKKKKKNILKPNAVDKNHFKVEDKW